MAATITTNKDDATTATNAPIVATVPVPAVPAVVPAPAPPVPPRPHPLASAPMVDPYVLTATSSIERRWLSLYRRLWRYRYMRRAVMIRLSSSHNHIIRQRTIKMLPITESWNHTTRAGPGYPLMWSNYQAREAKRKATTREQLIRENIDIYQRTVTEEQQWLMRRQRTIKWLDATAQKLWCDIIIAINKTHMENSNNNGTNGTATATATAATAAAAVRSSSNNTRGTRESKSRDDNDSHGTGTDTSTVYQVSPPSFIPLNKKDAEYKQIATRFGASSTEAIAAINKVYQTIPLLPTELPFTVITTQFGLLFRNNYFGDVPMGRRPGIDTITVLTQLRDAKSSSSSETKSVASPAIASSSSSSSYVLPSYMAGDTSVDDDVFTFDITNANHTLIRLWMSTTNVLVTVWNPNGQVYGWSVLGVVIDDGIVGRYYVRVARKPSTDPYHAAYDVPYSITVTASEATDMITRYRDVQLMMFGHVYESMVTRHFQRHNQWLRYQLSTRCLAAWRCCPADTVRVLLRPPLRLRPNIALRALLDHAPPLVPSSSLSSSAAKQRFIQLTATRYGSRLRDLLRGIMTRHDDAIAIMIEYAMDGDEPIPPISILCDTMTIPRYERPLHLLPSPYNDYPAWRFSPVPQSLPCTLRWHHDTQTVYRAYDHRRSLTIEWPLRRPYAAAEFQRVTLYQDGTCWLYGHLNNGSYYSYERSYGIGSYTLTPLHTDQCMNHNDSSEHHTNCEWQLTMAIRFVTPSIYDYAYYQPHDQPHDGWYREYPRIGDMTLPLIELRTRVSHAMLFDRHYIAPPLPSSLTAITATTTASSTTNTVPCWYRRVIVPADDINTGGNGAVAATAVAKKQAAAADGDDNDDIRWRYPAPTALYHPMVSGRVTNHRNNLMTSDHVGRGRRRVNVHHQWWNEEKAKVDKEIRDMQGAEVEEKKKEATESSSTSSSSGETKAMTTTTTTKKKKKPHVSLRRVRSTYAISGDDGDIPMQADHLSIWCALPSATTAPITRLPHARRVWYHTDDTRPSHLTHFPSIIPPPPPPLPPSITTTATTTTTHATAGDDGDDPHKVQTAGALSVDEMKRLSIAPIAPPLSNDTITCLIPTIFCDRPDMAIDALILHADPFGYTAPIDPH